jgi:LPS export ABC transporter protein LptC
MQKIIIFIFFAVSTWVGVLFAEEEKQVSQEVNDFSLVQFEGSGIKKWKLSGSSAELEDNKVMINEVSALGFGEKTVFKLKAGAGDFYRKEQVIRLEDNVIAKTADGARLTADSLNWDTGDKNVSTRDFVSIKKSGFEINGKGMVCDLEKNTAELGKNITASLNSPDSDFSFTTITCDGPLRMDYKNNKAVFLNNVAVKNKEGDISADRIDVYYNSETKKLKYVVARGNVKIANGNSTTYSDKAVYLVEEGKVVLPKNPKLVINNGISE